MSSRKSIRFVSSLAALATAIFLGACGQSKSQHSEVNASAQGGGNCPHSLNQTASQVTINFPGGLRLEGGQFKYCSFELNMGAGTSIIASTISGSALLSGSDSITLRREYRGVGAAGTSSANSRVTSSGAFSLSEQGNYAVTTSKLVTKFTFDLARAKSSSAQIDQIVIRLQ